MTPGTEAAAPLLAQARQLTEARLADIALRLEVESPGPVGEALAYALGTRGKRVRPALSLGAFRAAGGSGDAIAGVCAAVEIVHTYSLVHDDLPCMDDDARRRGRPTTHVVCGVPQATIAGWHLVPVAIEALATAASELGLHQTMIGKMAAYLLEASGIRGMVGGQWLDLEGEGKALSLSGLRTIHSAKTGALIQAAMVLGGMAAGASETQLDGLGRAGQQLGLAFQVADDVLDATATSGQLGKTAGRDAAMNKSTYVRELGIDGAAAEARTLAAYAVAVLEESGLASEELVSLAWFIIGRNS